MGRTRKQSTPAADTSPEDTEALEQAEMDEGGEQDGATSTPAEPEYPPAPAGPKAQPLAIEEKRVTLPRRNLGGQYKCKTCVRKDGTRHHPGTTLTLTDDEARHYLKHDAVEALD
jgi:hypothetical protein